MKKGYFLIVDILGFSNIVNNLPSIELSVRIQEWVDLVKELTSKFKIERFQLMSDTLFIGMSDSSTDSLRKLVSFSKDLLEKSLEKAIPLKGAITYGEYAWGDLIYGKAVISAHDLEVKQNWVGITLDIPVQNIDELFKDYSLICYMSPLKSGPLKLFPVVSWNIPDLGHLSSSLIKSGLAKKGQTLEHTWIEKINNTIIFKLYLKLLHLNKESADKFYGFSTLHSLDMFLSKANFIKPQNNC